jgi:hypothetical protein
LGHITGAGDNRIAKLRPQLLGSGRDAVEDSDPRTLFDKALYNSAANARTAARDQRHLPIDPTLAGPPLRRRPGGESLSLLSRAGRRCYLRYLPAPWQASQIGRQVTNGLGRRLILGGDFPRCRRPS